jgi:hypothetical protein
MEPVKGGGTFVMANGNQIQLSTNTNQPMFVMVGPETEVSVTGSAEQDYLKSGVTVEFVAELDKTRTVKEKIVKLRVISPTTQAGLFAPEFVASTKGDADGGKAKPLAHDPGIAEVPAKGKKARDKDADTLTGDLSSTGKSAKTPSGGTPLPGTYTVRGTIKMCKDRKITVSAGRGPTVKAEFTDDVTIEVYSDDVRLAQRDDRVTVEGQANKARPNLVMAKSVAIVLSNPLSGAKKKAHTERPAKTPAKTPAPKKKAAEADDLLGTEK